MGAKWLGCCMVAPFPSITKWQPYKFLKQLPIQNGHLGPRAVFQLTTPQNHSSTTYKQKQHVPTQGTHPRCWTALLLGKDLHHVLAYECQNNLKFPYQFTNFSLQMNAHYKMKEQGPLNTFNDHCPINLYKISILLQKCDGLTVAL